MALPILLRRISMWRTPEVSIDIPLPIRVPRAKLIQRQGEFSRYLRLAAAKCGKDGWILLLLDADDDCAGTLPAELLAQARAIAPDQRLSVVFAVREFEAWFLAAANSLHGHRSLIVDSVGPEHPERLRDAKGWLRARMSNYGATTDQPAFAALMDLNEAHSRSASFRKLCKEWDRQVQ